MSRKRRGPCVQKNEREQGKEISHSKRISVLSLYLFFFFSLVFIIFLHLFSILFFNHFYLIHLWLFALLLVSFDSYFDSFFLLIFFGFDSFFYCFWSFFCFWFSILRDWFFSVLIYIYVSLNLNLLLLFDACSLFPWSKSVPCLVDFIPSKITPNFIRLARRW